MKLSKLDLKTMPRDKRFHFVGIGGIGMSAMAEAMHKWGFAVQGSNDVMNENIESLRLRGIRAFIQHDISNLDGADYAVFSSAVPPDNIEIAEAKRRGLPIIARAEMLDTLMGLKKSIAISGTHGKTTTTAFVGIMLDAAGFDPTIIDGGIINRYHSHNRIGGGEWIVAEACEAFGNLKHFNADIAVVTNIDAEHMEFYKTFDNLKNYFREFIARVPDDGLVVGYADHPAVAELLAEFKGRKNIAAYGLEAGDITARNIKFNAGGTTFDAEFAGGGVLAGLRIPLFGEHNALNALAAIAIARFLKIPDAKVKAAMLEFTGVKHRFSKVADTSGGIRIFDDYAHHPKEIETTLAMAREVAGKSKIFAILQPHRYSRLTNLFDGFARCFGAADRVIIMPVYGAGEPAEGMKNSDDLYSAMKAAGANVLKVGHFDEIAPIILADGKSGDMVVSLGAGSIKNLIYDLPAQMESAKK
ncbi:MAG: UDP-N-acetylmuramate--L-alanine ligase [Rickettsiales bacterium]|jgi:UDP-N-acetylmuramate--alanine ligase|nr:UDP-N-acetylmuramate--L-alanine ligase [Rickettsiales bacterium]